MIFDTEAEAEAQQALDHACNIAVRNDPNYVADTTRWATPRQRLDGKWAYECCPHSDYTGMTTEEFDASNYPTEMI